MQALSKLIKQFDQIADLRGCKPAVPAPIKSRARRRRTSRGGAVSPICVLLQAHRRVRKLRQLNLRTARRTMIKRFRTTTIRLGIRRRVVRLPRRRIGRTLARLLRPGHT